MIYAHSNVNKKKKIEWWLVNAKSLKIRKTDEPETMKKNVHRVLKLLQSIIISRYKCWFKISRQTCWASFVYKFKISHLL